MAQILIRYLDDDIVAILKARARSNHRSLQDEVKALIEDAVGAPRAASVRDELRKFRASLDKKRFSASANLIRRARDGR